MSEFVLDFFEGKNLATIEKKKHSYLMIDGHDQADIYILKDGIVKTSIILSDGREFNLMYLKGFDVLSLLKDEIKKVTSASFRIRIESDMAVFYRVNRKLFSKFLSENKELRDYMDAYYRKKLSEAIYRQQLMTMNGKNGAVCALFIIWLDYLEEKLKRGSLLIFKSQMMILQVFVVYLQEIV